MQTYQTAINRAPNERIARSSCLRRERERDAAQPRSPGTRMHCETPQDEADKKRLAADIERLKGGVASFKTMEQDRITVLQQAEAQLQKAQDAFDGVQSELGQLLKGLR